MSRYQQGKQEICHEYSQQQNNHPPNISQVYQRAGLLMSGCDPPTRLIPVSLVIIKLSGPIPGNMLVVLSSLRTATEVLRRLAMGGSVTKVIIPILTICLPPLVTIRWRRIIFMWSGICTISIII